MKKLVVIISLVLTSGICQASGDIHWTYSGNEGPEHWGELSDKFTICSTGKNQSPIDISGLIEADLQPISFSYSNASKDILNNGHTIQVNYNAGSEITVDGINFELKQFHFHAPSENLIDGKSYPLEAHLVHADKDGNLAVIGVMFIEGKENKVLAKAWAKMPKNANDKQTLIGVAANDLLPKNHDYYRFNGSLTTPPCSEGVRWLVMKNAVTASKSQIETFTNVMHHANNRPVQATNARPVLK
ncbi:MAG TPA: carbonic anhydrase family protein [Gammaproteobacteria bacterium]